jgi:membrane protein DedA with SNARE-associated domain
MLRLHPEWIRRACLAFALFAALSTAWFGLRSYRTFVLLQSAYAAGMPLASSVRGWMSLHYLSTTFRVPESDLIARLGLPPETSPYLTIRSLAERQAVAPFDYVQRVQRSLAETVPQGEPAEPPTSPGWFDWINDEVLSALQRYGYSVLALTLVLGAIGLPVPTGLSAAVAGSLSAAGRMDWLGAAAIATAASVAGDVAAYGVGRFLSVRFLARRGTWFGYTVSRQARARMLFERWGGLTVLVTRTLVSHLSSVVSLLAGMSHYRFAGFVAFALTGRLLWTGAYLGLGYAIGGNLEAAADFLKNLSGLLVSVTLFAGCALIASGRVGLRA